MQPMEQPLCISSFGELVCSEIKTYRSGPLGHMLESYGGTLEAGRSLYTRHILYAPLSLPQQEVCAHVLTD